MFALSSCFLLQNAELLHARLSPLIQISHYLPSSKIRFSAWDRRRNEMKKCKNINRVTLWKLCLVLRVPERAPSPDTLPSATGLHTLLCTSRPPAPAVAAQTRTVRDDHGGTPYWFFLMPRFSGQCSFWLDWLEVNVVEDGTKLQTRTWLLFCRGSKNKPGCISRFQSESQAILAAGERKPARSGSGATRAFLEMMTPLKHLLPF